MCVNKLLTSMHQMEKYWLQCAGFGFIAKYTLQRPHQNAWVSQPDVLVMHWLCVTQWMAKNTVPVSIWGLPIVWKQGGRQKLGTPRFHLMFVPIQGLIYTYKMTKTSLVMF